MIASGFDAPEMRLVVEAYDRACTAIEARLGRACTKLEERQVAKALLEAYRTGARHERELVGTALAAAENFPPGAEPAPPWERCFGQPGTSRPAFEGSAIHPSRSA